MYVEALSEGSRTRVRFPPPPPILKRKALEIKGLFILGGSKSSVAGPSLGVIREFFSILIDTLPIIQYSSIGDAIPGQISSLGTLQHG